MRKNFSWFPVAALALAMPVFVGCDRLKKVADTFRKSGKGSPAKVVEGTSSPDQISEITKVGHAAFIARKNALVIVDFHAEWCGPCKLLGPVLQKAVAAHPGVVYLGKVDVDQARDLATEQKVSGIPDVRIYQNGKEVDRFVGYPGEKVVTDKIAKLAKGIRPAPVAKAQPASATPSEAAAEPAIKPFTKGWLPPGMTKEKAGAPVQP